MKKALLVTTVSGFVPQFEMNNVFLLQENGYEVHYAADYNYVFYGKDNSRLDGTGIVRHQIDFSRTPYSRQTLAAYKQLDKLISEIRFDLIHCHTPVGSFLARLAAKKYKIKKVIYTAHGFHFYKGAPIVNWFLYYSAERFMARYTDALITINKEDFINAQKFKLKKGGKVYYVAGAGIDVKKYSDAKLNPAKKKELGISDKDFVILSVGELNGNKNQETVIRGLSKVKHNNIKYLICGDGVCKKRLINIVKELHMQECVKLLGYRMDIPEIEKVSDVFVFPSFREGLPVSMMEAMASGLPVIASEIRGNIDLIRAGRNGFLLNPKRELDWGKKIVELMDQKDLLKTISQNNVKDMRKYDKSVIKDQMRNIYRELGLIK